MSETTDRNLYQLALGLPEEISSPNHYQLLGLDARTADPQIIKNAATDQNRKLLAWQNSDRYAEIRALTLKVVEARDVLLNEESRSAYDATLGDWGLGGDEPWIEQDPEDEPLSVICPDCEADFKLRNRNLIGRRVPCPECGFRFKVTPIAEPVVELVEVEPVRANDDWDQELSELDNFDNMEDLPGSIRPSVSRRDDERNIFDVHEAADEDEFPEYEDYQSSRRTASGSRNRRREIRPSKSHSRRKSRSRNEPSKLPVILGGVLMAVGMVVLAGVLVQRAFAPDAPFQDQFAYLPADSRAFAHLRVSDIARSPIFQDFLTRDRALRERVDRFRTQTGMDLQTLDSLSIAIRAGDVKRLRSLDLVDLSQRGDSFVAVARANRDWDRARLIGSHTTSKTHNSETYHEFPAAISGDDWALYLPDSRTLVFGTTDEVKAAIDRQGQSPNWPAMDFLEPGDPLVIVNRENLSATDQSPVAASSSNPTGTVVGSGFSLEGDRGAHLTFVQHPTQQDAIAHEERVISGASFPQQPLMPGTTEGRECRRHGRVVTLVDERRFPRFSAKSSSVFSAISILAGLGKNEEAVPAPVANNPQTPPPTNNPLAPPVANPAPAPGPVRLQPAPAPGTLDAHLLDLQNGNNVRITCMRLSQLAPDPNRREEVAKALENVIRTGDQFEKMYAGRALGVWGSPDNVPLLLNELNGKDSILKRDIVEALGKLKDPRALPALVQAIENIHTRHSAIKALKSFGSDAEDEVLKALANNEWQTQMYLCDVLREIGTSRSLGPLAVISQTGHPAAGLRARTAANSIQNRP